MTGDSMIIVSGRIYVRGGRRDAFLAASMEAVMAARRSSGCLDPDLMSNIVSADVSRHQISSSGPA